MEISRAAVPHRRLSGFYFFYFASIGVFVPYWGLFLQSLGFSAAEISQIVTISLLSKVVSPYLVAWLADHCQCRMRIVRICSFLAAAIFSMLWVAHDFFALAVVSAGFSFFWHSVLPQLEVTTLNHLSSRPQLYGRIRLWGSVGFIVAVSGFGALMDAVGVAALLPVMLALLLLIALMTLSAPDAGAASPDAGESGVWSVLRQPPVMMLLLSAGLMQFSHGPYYTFFSIHLDALGYSSVRIGLLWALGVLSEIVVFLMVPKWIGVWGAARLFQLSILITALRWVLIGLFADNPWVLVPAQMMHAASYGLFHAAAITLINDYFPGRLQGRGQALYGSVSFGLGNALGTLAAGAAWGAFGGGWVFCLAGLVCLVAGLMALWVRAPTTLPSHG